jgi:hypothetical protein
MGPQLLVDCSSLAERFERVNGRVEGIATPIARGSTPPVRTCALLEKRPIPPEQHPKKNDEQVKALVAATLIFMPMLAGWLALAAGQQ